MIKTKKQMYLVIGAFALVMLLGGVTYAFFNYTRTGSANTIRVGRIAFNTNQTDTIGLTNAFPITRTMAAEDTTNTDDVVITITGDTSYSGGVEYLVTATDVTNTVNSKTVPISIIATASNGLGTSDDSYFTNRGGNSSIYKVLANETVSNNDQLLVGYIAPDNNQTGVNGTITIRAYLDSDLVTISDTYNGTDTATDNMGTTSTWVDDRTVLTTTEWNGLQTNGVSFKVKVEANEGTWVEAPVIVYTDASCFSTSEIGNLTYTYNTNRSSSDIASCVTYLTSQWGAEEEGQTVGVGETYEAFCSGTGTVWGDTILYSQSLHDEDYEYLDSINIVNSSGHEIQIDDYDVVNCGTNVSIPDNINGIPVTVIGSSSFEKKPITSVRIPNSVTSIGGNAFYKCQLTSVTIGDSVEYIGDVAFSENNLTSVTIPNSVISIGYDTFSFNQLTSVTIGNGVTAIGSQAFKKSDTSNPDLTNITIDKSCFAIKEFTKYPWLDGIPPYTGSYSGGTTIYGSNNEACDVY